jgi:hypothetical protein
MTDPQPLQASTSAGAYADIVPAPGEDDVILGWECANPALQIERWGQDVAAAAEESC